MDNSVAVGAQQDQILDVGLRSIGQSADWLGVMTVDDVAGTWSIFLPEVEATSGTEKACVLLQRRVLA